MTIPSNDELVELVHRDLNDRQEWEKRAEMFYRMRHHGLRRKVKPFDGAADLHFPLADSFIERLRPAFFQQLYATDTMAQFVSPRKEQSGESVVSAGRWFDYQVKQRSNLESEILTVIDWMLMVGRAVMKVRWNPDKKMLAFDAIDPRMIIVPATTMDLATADRLVHVRQFTEEAFLRSKEFDLKRIKRVKLEIDNFKAARDAQESGLNQSQSTKDIREGIVTNESVITVWEVWQPDDNGKLGYHCFCPTVPEVNLKDRVENPYDHDELPFIDFPYEIKDKGWYSPRGLVEMVATFEAELTNLLNQKHDTLTLTNRPVFLNERNEGTNIASFKLTPGQALPRGLKPAVWPKVPFDFQEAIQAVREIAEGRVTVPDFGITRLSDTTQRRTATEVNAVSQMFQQSSDLRLRVFRIGLGKLYRQAWKVLLQYAKKDLNFFYVDQFEEITTRELHDEYAIIPNGSADGVNKAYLFQKAISRFQMFNGHPFIDQMELVKTVLEADEPSIVRRLVTNPGLRANDEREEQAMEIAVMAKGLPATVSPNDDHVEHLRVCLAYIVQNSQAGGVQPGVNELRLLEFHITQHLQALEQIDGKAAREIRQAFESLGPQRTETATTEQEEAAA